MLKERPLGKTYGTLKKLAGEATTSAIGTTEDHTSVAAVQGSRILCYHDQLLRYMKLVSRYTVTWNL